MAASVVRIWRNASRASLLKPMLMITRTGTIRLIHRVRRQFIHNRMPTMASNFIISLKRVTMTVVNISCMFWMSLVSRVTRRPTGLAWK